jgi:enamine deaminase RidA (YjgF/YER057c/UK114 family)
LGTKIGLRHEVEMIGKRDAIVSATWEPFYEETRVPAAVRDGDQLHVSGHTGEDRDGRFPDQLEAQIRGTFRNLTETLTAAGTDWRQVVSLTSYHVGLRGQEEALLRVAGEFMEAPLPAWTAVGVSELWPPEAVLEISCVARLGGTGG